MAIRSLSGRLCSDVAAAEAQDPIGSGGVAARALFVEMPTPWGERFYDADEDGSLQERMRAVQYRFFRRAREDGTYERMLEAGIPYFNGLSPDPEWSRPGERRILLVTRLAGPLASFDVAEYVFPFESPRIVEMVEAYFEAPEQISSFDEHWVERAGQRELFVCTHGHVDVCCARFGVPLYRQARAAYPLVRAWRTTHFGGHRFAPTAWELPSGYKWAFLDEDAAAQVLNRAGHPASLLMKVRGWSGVAPMVQPLDRLGLERFGWPWLGFKRQGEIQDEDREAKRWRVRLNFEASDGRSGAYEGIVVVGRELPDSGCGRSWGESDHTSPEYRLESWTTA